MDEIISKTINDVIAEYVSNPFGFHELRKHHERVLHYLHHDFFIKNSNDSELSKYMFRWEYPTHQRYKKYLFCWDEIPGNESRLKDYLIQNFNVNWIKTTEFKKSDDDTTVSLLVEKTLFFSDLTMNIQR